MGEMRNELKVSVAKPEGNTPLGKPRRRWENTIKIQLRDIRCEGLNWMHLADDRDWWRALVKSVMNLRFSLNTGHLTSS
jgi:hypothetical protein